MPEYALTNFYEGLRALLGDEGDTVSGYDYPALQLDGVLRTVVRMGMVPGVALGTGDVPVALAAAPANPDTWGYMVAQSARLMLCGPAGESFRTRALSVTVNPIARRDAMANIDQLLADLDARGNVGGSATDTGHKGLFATEDDVMTRLVFVNPPDPSLST